MERNCHFRPRQEGSGARSPRLERPPELEKTLARSRVRFVSLSVRSTAAAPAHNAFHFVDGVRPTAHRNRGASIDRDLPERVVFGRVSTFRARVDDGPAPERRAAGIEIRIARGRGNRHRATRSPAGCVGHRDSRGTCDELAYEPLLPQETPWGTEITGGEPPEPDGVYATEMRPERPIEICSLPR
jgi:hypothetical protein